MLLFYQWFGWNVGRLFSIQFVDQPWSWARFADMLAHLPVPIIVIGTAGTAGLIRVLRSSLLDELAKQYVITARAKVSCPQPAGRRVRSWRHPTTRTCRESARSLQSPPRHRARPPVAGATTGALDPSRRTQESQGCAEEVAA